MLRVGVVSLFPEMFETLSRGGVTARSMQRGILHLRCWNPRDFTEDRHRTTDDRPYGGGPGMVMLVKPLRAAIGAARRELGEGTHCVHLSPQGRRLDQAGVRTLMEHSSLLLVCGRYEGIDERVVERDVDAEWSIGDFVLSGGELAAMVVIDAMARLLPGVLGHEDSAAEDSFSSGLLDCPHYSRPEEIDGQTVPAELLSGHHEEIRRWRLKQALVRTLRRRPDLLRGLSLDQEQRSLLADLLNETGRLPDHLDPMP